MSSGSEATMRALLNGNPKSVRSFRADPAATHAMYASPQLTVALYSPLYILRGTFLVSKVQCMTLTGKYTLI